MQIEVSSVESVGVAIRAMRKVHSIRQDDVPGVSHMFLRDLEKGKDTVQFGLCSRCSMSWESEWCWRCRNRRLSL